jgi:hypothetical protein
MNKKTLFGTPRRPRAERAESMPEPVWRSDFMMKEWQNREL